MLFPKWWSVNPRWQISRCWWQTPKIGATINLKFFESDRIFVNPADTVRWPVYESLFVTFNLFIYSNPWVPYLGFVIAHRKEILSNWKQSIWSPKYSFRNKVLCYQNWPINVSADSKLSIFGENGSDSIVRSSFWLVDQW